MSVENSNIETIKADSMGRTMPNCSWQCNYSIIFTPKHPFFSSYCILKFWLMHLHLSVTSKWIKLQMWDCAQKKALEKNFNLVTDKSCLKLAKGAKMSYGKTCVFFNSGSNDCECRLFSFILSTRYPASRLLLPAKGLLLSTSVSNLWLFTLTPLFLPGQKWLSEIPEILLQVTSIWSLFLGSGPKGPMSCRTQGWISLSPSVRAYVRTSVRTSPP